MKRAVHINSKITGMNCQTQVSVINGKKPQDSPIALIKVWAAENRNGCYCCTVVCHEHQKLQFKCSLYSPAS